MTPPDFPASSPIFAHLPHPQPGQRPAPCVMVLGTSSGAGKSWFTTALLAYYRARGLRVAPFKAQNMSANARPARLWSSASLLRPTSSKAVLGRGQPPLAEAAAHNGSAPALGAISAAQHLQARAAGIVPDVRMNPLLLMPTSERTSQVVLLGQPRPDIAAVPWRERAPLLWPTIAAALDSLRAEFDLIVIEGAGSPAEVNLRASDVVNLRVAHHAGAHCLLVADIDRGGAFAHLLGTFEALDAPDRALIRGFVLNKFRGDAALLAPAPAWLHSRTGVPTVAIVPMLAHDLPDEDSLDAPHHAPNSAPNTEANTESNLPPPIAIIALPRLRCQDEFAPLQAAHVRLVWAHRVADLQQCAALIVPASADIASDLAWLRQTGLDAAITQFARAGGHILGIAEGANILGEALISTETPPTAANIAQNTPNPPKSLLRPTSSKAVLGRGQPHHASLPTAFAANAPGLGLLPLVTLVQTDQTLHHAEQTTVQLPSDLRGPLWSPLSGQSLHIWSVGQHRTQLRPDIEAAQPQRSTEPIAGRFWQNPSGHVSGVLWHGSFENPAFLAAFCALTQPQNRINPAQNPPQSSPQTPQQNPALEPALDETFSATFTHMARALPQWFELAANASANATAKP